MRTSASGKDGSLIACECCETGRMNRSIERVEFVHGDGAEAVVLSADVPVWSCDACDFGYEDDDAEILRHEAVCRHLGRMTPAELKRFRLESGYTQQELADLTQLGIASVKRWERGNQIQSAFVDRVFRTLLDHHALAAMRTVATPRPVTGAKPRFRTDLSAQSRRDATVFRLRLRAPGEHREAA